MSTPEMEVVVPTKAIAPFGAVEELLSSPASGFCEDPLPAIV
jgi:hypothetical protein